MLEFCYHVGMSYYWCIMLLCRGQIVALLGDTLGAKLPECMPIFVDRLRNEITRLTAVRALSQIARYMCKQCGLVPRLERAGISSW